MAGAYSPKPRGVSEAAAEDGMAEAKAQKRAKMRFVEKCSAYMLTADGPVRYFRRLQQRLRLSGSEVGLNDESSGTQVEMPMHVSSTGGFIDMQHFFHGQDQSTRSSAARVNRQSNSCRQLLGVTCQSSVVSRQKSLGRHSVLYRSGFRNRVSLSYRISQGSGKDGGY